MGRSRASGTRSARAVHLLLPLVLLMYLLARDYSPFYASSASVVALWLSSQIRRETRLGLRETLAALEAATREGLMLSATSAIAARVLGIIMISGLMLKVTAVTLALAKGSLLLGIGIVALISSILGIGLPVTSAYIIVSTLGAPALTELGSSLLAAHLHDLLVRPDGDDHSAGLHDRVRGSADRRSAADAHRLGSAASGESRLYVIPLMFAYTQILSGSWPAMLFDAAGGMLWLIAFAVVTEGYFRSASGMAGRVVRLAAERGVLRLDPRPDHPPHGGLAAGRGRVSWAVCGCSRGSRGQSLRIGRWQGGLVSEPEGQTGRR